MAKRQTPEAASARTQPQSASVQIEMRPAPEATEAISLRREAAGLIVTDRSSHAAALEFVRGCKQLARKIEDHWSRITRNVDDLKRNLLTLKRQDLEPVEEAIRVVSARALDYAQKAERREREESDRRRREAEMKAEAERKRQLEEAERDALKAEESSPLLSAREETFLAQFMAGVTAERAAQIAGYKDPKAAGQRLMASDKINDAIQAKRTANAIREQAAVTRQQPLNVVSAPPVESQRAKVVGTRTVTTRSCEVVDANALIEGVVAGSVVRDALLPNQVFLNGEAKRLGDTFESVYPGCRLIVKQTIAG